MAISTSTQRSNIQQHSVCFHGGDENSVPILVLQDLHLSCDKRLIVLIPDMDVNESVIARAIWELAYPLGLPVLLLGLTPGINEEPNMRRRLIAIAALIREPRVHVEMRLDYGRNWVGSVKSILEPGDVVICHAEQQIGILHKSLDQVFKEYSIPVLTVTGFYPMIRRSVPALLRESIFWIVSMTVLAGFFWLQIQTLRVSEEWVKDILLGMSVLVEIGLLWICNSISV